MVSTQRHTRIAVIHRVMSGLHSRLVAGIAVIVLLQTALWGVLALSVATPIASQQATQTLTDAARTASTRVDQTMRVLDALSLQIVVNPDVQRALRREARSGNVGFTDTLALNEAIGRATRPTPSIPGHGHSSSRPPRS